MSRWYEMSVTIEDFDKAKRDEIEKAASEEWEFEDFGSNPDQIFSSGQSNLCGGESEDEFAKRLATAIFKANGKPCEVNVRATCLEDLPSESYSFSEGDNLLDGLTRCVSCEKLVPSDKITLDRDKKPHCEDCFDERMR
jgi:hypothetical protein